MRVVLALSISTHAGPFVSLTAVVETAGRVGTIQTERSERTGRMGGKAKKRDPSGEK